MPALTSFRGTLGGPLLVLMTLLPSSLAACALAALHVAIGLGGHRATLILPISQSPCSSQLTLRTVNFVCVSGFLDASIGKSFFLWLHYDQSPDDCCLAWLVKDREQLWSASKWVSTGLRVCCLMDVDLGKIFMEVSIMSTSTLENLWLGESWEIFMTLCLLLAWYTDRLGLCSVSLGLLSHGMWNHSWTSSLYP